MLRRQGIVLNQKKLRRLYREEKLQVRRRGGSKRALANERRRSGYRRLAILLKREGIRMNLKKVYRLYREERLVVRRRGGRRRPSHSERTSAGASTSWPMP